MLFFQCLESFFQYKFLKTCYWKSIVLGELMLDLSDLALAGIRATTSSSRSISISFSRSLVDMVVYQQCSSLFLLEVTDGRVVIWK